MCKCSPESLHNVECGIRCKCTCHELRRVIFHLEAEINRLTDIQDLSSHPEAKKPR